MDAQNLLSLRKQIYDKILMYIDSAVEDEDENLYSDLIDILQSSNITENEHELKELFILISHIEMYHHPYHPHLSKIEKILQYLLKDIKQEMLGYEICNIFRKNRRILLYLLQSELISIDDSIIQLIYDTNPATQYLFYATELKKSMSKETCLLIDEEMKKQGEDFYNHFEENRQIGQNESYLCKLIREDSVDDFIEYTSRTNTNLSKEIDESIFETNSYLIENKPTIIEYAAFFGAIQIFQFLRLNEVELKGQLWNYAIHGRNPEIIHLLEENKIELKRVLDNCYEEAIKCHHNEIATYIINNYEVKIDTDYSYIKYWNYSFFPDIEDIIKFMPYLCQYDHKVLVGLLLREPCQNLNPSLLYYAVESDNLDILNLLLSNPKTEISDICFMNSQKLTKITIPSFIKSIGSSSFFKCSNLCEITIPSSVNTIGERAFSNCVSLKHLTIPPSVTSIGKFAFRSCSSLTEIELPPGLTIIEEGLFYECSGLKKITIPPSVTSIEKIAFTRCSSLTEIELPPGLTIIKEGLFSSCSSLRKITIPPSVTSIEESAFKFCSSLTEIELPPDLTIINEYLFYACFNLRKIKIPSKVTIISSNAFGLCYSLNDVNIPQSVTSIEQKAFPKSYNKKKSCNIY